MSILRGEKMQWRITVAVTAILIVGACAMFGLICRETRQEAREQDAQGTPVPQEQEPALPLTGMIIAVDPGHGGYDGGARSVSGVWEKELNLAVALAAQKSLIRRGARVVMTRSVDEDLCSADRPAGQTMKRQDMERRVAIAAQAPADLVLSIHMNQYRDRRESGPQVFYRAGSDGGRLLAGCIQAAMNGALQPRRAREAMSGDYFILQLEAPSVLVECGFISNPEEEKRLLDADYQAQTAEAVADGVCEYVMLARRLREDRP